MCPKCNTEFPATLDYFYKNRNSLDRVCKSCAKAYSQKYYLNNKQKHAKRGWSWRLEKIGFTAELYYSMLKQQKNVCALCKKSPEDVKLSADHNHSTGKARGLLCHSCNIAVGYLEKYDQAWLELAQSYVKQDGFYKP